MPYDSQPSSKLGHSDIVRNPQVQAFLQECQYLREPSDAEGRAIASSYEVVEPSETLPGFVIAMDGSRYSQPISERFPMVQVGYVKASMVIIDVEKYRNLSARTSSPYVDPMQVAALMNSANSITFGLPGSNIRYKNAPTVQSGFRRAVWEALSGETTLVRPSPRLTAADMLVHIWPLKDEPGLVLDKCPSCRHKPAGGFVFTSGQQTQVCPECGEPLYPTDVLRLHEAIADFGDCTQAVTRCMNVTEHLLLASLVRVTLEGSPKRLSELAFIIDGPPAIFGPPAKLGLRLMSFYESVREEMRRRNLPPPVIIGIQKTGQVVDHAESLKRFLPVGACRAVDDDYRREHVQDVSSPNFGDETYYGQDFIYRSPKGGVFVFALPYPFKDKSNRSEFVVAKAQRSMYSEFSRALAILNAFESDLYANSMVPVLLAHRHASISLVPGGKILDLVTRTALTGHAGN